MSLKGRSDSGKRIEVISSCLFPQQAADIWGVLYTRLFYIFPHSTGHSSRQTARNLSINSIEYNWRANETSECGMVMFVCYTACASNEAGDLGICPIPEPGTSCMMCSYALQVVQAQSLVLMIICWFGRNSHVVDSLQFAYSTLKDCRHSWGVVCTDLQPKTLKRILSSHTFSYTESILEKRRQYAWEIPIFFCVYIS